MFPSFSPTHPELSLGLRIIDTFSDHFSFNSCNEEKKDKLHLQQLDSVVIESSLSQSIAIVTMDASIKNNVATSILHMHISNHPFIKTLHHAAFVTSAEAELFAIRCGINQALSKENISKIIVFIDSIHVAKKIFDLSSHPLQIHAVAILNELWQFFSRDSNNSIEFWECPSCLNWHLHKAVDLETKASNPTPVYPCKMSWDYSKKTKCDDILNNWKMTFQALDGKGNQFLNLLDDTLNCSMPKENLSFNCLDTQTRYVHMCPEQSQIMLQLENIGLDFSLGKNLSAHAVCTLLNHVDIFSMIAEDLTAIEIQDETLLAILLCFWRLILTLLLS